MTSEKKKELLTRCDSLYSCIKELRDEAMLALNNPNYSMKELFLFEFTRAMCDLNSARDFLDLEVMTDD